jgi:hypothetical protein
VDRQPKNVLAHSGTPRDRPPKLRLVANVAIIETKTYVSIAQFWFTVLTFQPSETKWRPPKGHRVEIDHERRAESRRRYERRG